MSTNATRIFDIARTAYERMATAPDDRAGGQMDALVAILFSVAALEAFINEASEIAGDMMKRLVPDHPSVATFADLLRAAEGARASTAFKFDLASAAFTDRIYDRGKLPYQDFEVLLALRNEIVHVKGRDVVQNAPESSDVRPPRLVTQLRARNITAAVSPENDATWLLWVSTRAVARWACNTATAIVGSVLEMIPEGPLKTNLDSHYDRLFVPIPVEETQ